MGVSMTTVQALRDHDDDAVHLRELGLQTLSDDAILAKALDESRIVLTFDLDFGDLLAASGAQTPSVVLFRMRNQTPKAVTVRLMEVLSRCADALASGALIVVEDRAYRVRHLPIRRP
jgi:predicted nuclease of predicted toxin-antitoxin system